MKIFNSIKDKAVLNKENCKCRFREKFFNVFKIVCISLLVSVIVARLSAERNVKKVITKDPKFIIEALQKMDMNERKKQREESEKKAPEVAKKIINSNNPFLGNKNGSKVIVEFFDYACGHCKRQSIELMKLVDEDKNIKVVLADLPILSQNSLSAAQLGLYINKKNPEKFAKYYKLVSEKGVDNNSLKSVLSSLGLPQEYLKKSQQDKEVLALIEANYSYAREVGLQGTPALIINGKFIGGGISANDIKSML